MSKEYTVQYSSTEQQHNLTESLTQTKEKEKKKKTTSQQQRNTEQKKIQRQS